MAWKEVTVGNSSGMINWSGDGEPNVSNKLSISNAYVVNIPSIEGGEGTIISDGVTANSLIDGSKTNNAYFIMNSTSYPVQMITNRNGISIDLSNNKLVSKIFLYVTIVTGSELGPNTFYIMTSNDGLNWVFKEFVESIDVSFDVSNLASGYGVIGVSLTTPLFSRYIAIRTLTNLDITNTSSDYIREIECYSPNGLFGSEGDEYRDNLTGKKYKKINNEWLLIYTPQQIPAHIVGDSPLPPSAVGLPVGSLYFVKSS